MPIPPQCFNQDCPL